MTHWLVPLMQALTVAFCPSASGPTVSIWRRCRLRGQAWWPAAAMPLPGLPDDGFGRLRPCRW